MKPRTLAVRQSKNLKDKWGAPFFAKTFFIYQTTRSQFRKVLIFINILFCAVNMCVYEIALFWVVTQRILMANCRRFGTAYRSHLQAGFWTALSLNIGLTWYPEASVNTILQYITSQKSEYLIYSAEEAWNQRIAFMICRLLTFRLFWFMTPCRQFSDLKQDYVEKQATQQYWINSLRLWAVRF